MMKHICKNCCIKFDSYKFNKCPDCNEPVFQEWGAEKWGGPDTQRISNIRMNVDAIPQYTDFDLAVWQQQLSTTSIQVINTDANGMIYEYPESSTSTQVLSIGEVIEQYGNQVDEGLLRQMQYHQLRQDIAMDAIRSQMGISAAQDGQSISPISPT